MSTTAPRWWLAPLAALLALVAILALSLGLVLLALGHPPSGGQWTVIALSLLAIVLAAVSYPAVRAGVTQLLHRRLGGDQAAPDDVLSGFVAGLSRAVPLDETLLRLTETLRETLALSTAEVWTADDRALMLAVSDPPCPIRRLPLAPELRAALARAEVRGEAWARVRFPGLLEERGDGPVAIHPIVHAGVVLGVLVVGRAPKGPPVTIPETTILAELCRHLALALHNLQLDSALQVTHEALRRSAIELRESRARVVAAADAARLKIERDLHDGAQQRLLEVSMRLGMTRSGLAAERECQLALAASALSAAMAELRELAHGIYPPLLAESGLQQALTAVCRSASIPARPEIAVSRRYAPAIEATVYFCCLESLNNAAKHAGAGAVVTLQVNEAQNELEFVVADDGAGFDVAGAVEGIGLLSIRDRIGAVGGRAEISSVPGAGVRVAGWIPLITERLSAPPRPGTAAPPSHAG